MFNILTASNIQSAFRILTAQRRGAFFFVAVLGLLLASPLAAIEPGKPGPWNPKGINPFEFTDQFGKTIRNDDLKGKPWIVGFIFTRCLGPCPTVTKRMQDLREQTGVKAVSITVDPAFDTPEVLGRYAKNFVGLKEDDPNPWLFLHADQAKVYPLIKESFLLPVEELQGAFRKPGFEVLHSTEILLVNEQNQVTAKFNALKDEEVAKLRRILQGKDPFPPPPEGVKEDPANTLKLGDGSTLRIVREPAEEEKQEPETEGTDEAEGKSQGEEKPVAQPNAPKPPPPAWALKLPAVNASLNATAGILLVIGYVLIKRGKRTAHKNVMLAAFGMSVLFLGCYLVYHSYVTSRRFQGPLVLMVIYYPILVSHVLLAMTVPFLAGKTIFLGLQQRWTEHKRLAKITYPIWIYVSVTGVIIYLMLYQLPIG